MSQSKRLFFINFFKDFDLDIIYQICFAALEGSYKRDKVLVLKSQGERFELTNLLIEHYLKPVDRSGGLIDFCKKFFSDFYSSEPNIASAVQEKLNSLDAKDYSEQTKLQAFTDRCSEGKKDIVIMTVIPVELAAAKDILGIQDNSETRARTQDSHTIFLHGEISSERTRRKYSLALGCIGSAGNYNSAQATTEIIQAYSPKLLLLIGIAAGIQGKAKLGEVVFSERVVGYESAALRQLEDGTQVEQPRPDMPSVPNGIHQDVVFYLATHKERGSNSQQRLETSFRRIGGVFPTLSPDDQKHLQESDIIHGIELDICAIASGEKLLKDPSVLSDIRDHQHGRVKVGEMEAIGFATACQRMRRDWLVIRGVSDFGDSYKSDVFHPLASQTAAVVLADFLKYGLDLRDLS